MRIVTMARHLGAVALFLATPAFAQSGSSEYGNAGPWTIYRTMWEGKVEACHATTDTGAIQA